MENQIPSEVLLKFKGKYSPLLPAFTALYDFIKTNFPEVICYIKTIYIGFAIDASLMAIVFPKGDALDLGLSLPHDFSDVSLSDAKQMGFSGITKSVYLSSPEQVDERMKELLRTAHESASIRERNS